MTLAICCFCVCALLDCYRQCNDDIFVLQVPRAVFVLVSFKWVTEGTSLDAVKNAVAASASNKSMALAKSLNEEAKRITKSG